MDGTNDMDDMAEYYANKSLLPGFAGGLAEITKESAHPTAEEITKAKELYERWCAAALDTLDPDADPIAPREFDYHLLHRTALHDTLLQHLSQRVAELTTAVHNSSDDGHTAAAGSRMRHTNRRLGNVERGLGELRTRVRFLEARVTSLARWQEQMVGEAGGGGDGVGGGNGGGGSGGKKRSKKRKGRAGEAVDVSGGGGGSSAAAASSVAGELGEVEALLAEVMKRVGEFRITNGLDDIVEDQEAIADEDTDMATGKEDKGKEVARTEETA
ncbi:hypothetical protein B0I37DRAFT_431400 [Chaetomium sp. MPI-CAGE-AT-0009]|nr:hypothetical protein B0I37DRAFT_431400 [Chaetomium sp. MPI-CAGE-AT-0009]